MKILSLGLDKSILKKTSALAVRTVEYGDLVEKYTVIVPSQKNEKIELSEKATAYGSGGDNKLSRFIKIYNLAKKLLREEKYDAITVQEQYYLALIGLCLAKKFKAGLEIQIHGRGKYGGLRKIVADYIIPRASAIRAVSQRLARELTGKYKIDREKITVVPIYVEVKNKKPEIKSGENDGKFIFLTASRLVPVKNIGMQIEAMAEVIKKYPNIELWIIGDGPEKEKLKSEISNLKLEKKIIMLGWKDDLDKYYNMADAFLLTSNAEGWGMVIVEAASFGLPIIMTDVGCAGEVIKSGESGLVISPGDKQKLVEAMLKIIEDENLRKKLGENAKLAVSRLPSKEQTLDLYKKSWGIAIVSKL